MSGITVWWNNLHEINRWFFMAAAFFSVFMIWQLVMAIVGLGGGADLDTHVDLGAHDAPHDAADTVSAFKLLSVRSIIAFFTLFTWAAALYMAQRVPVSRALLYGILWGTAAMLAVSLVFNWLAKMTATGTIDIRSSIGSVGTVYLDIPATGQGEIRVLCSGVMTHLKATVVDGAALKAGTAVKILKVIGPNEVQVIKDNQPS